MIFILKKSIMACACKSSNGAKKQVSQITKRTTVSSSSQAIRKVTNNSERKQIIIKRPVR